MYVFLLFQPVDLLWINILTGEMCIITSLFFVSPPDSTVWKDRSAGSARQHGRVPEQVGGGEVERRPWHQHGMQGSQESDQCPEWEHLPGPHGAADRGTWTTGWLSLQLQNLVSDYAFHEWRLWLISVALLEAQHKVKGCDIFILSIKYCVIINVGRGKTHKKPHIS